MGTAKTETLVKLRDKFLTESLSTEGSYPPAGVEGDGNYDFTKRNVHGSCSISLDKILGEDGKVKTKPRGIYPGPNRSGRLRSSFFQDAAYITIGDPYIDPASIERRYQLSKKKKFPHDTEFKPADGPKSDPCNPIFKYMPDYVEVKKNYRGPDGKIPTGPKNIVTSPSKKGPDGLFSRPAEHIKDEYDRKRILDFEERKANKKKLQDQPFKVGSPGGRTFWDEKQTYGTDGIPSPKPKPKPQPPKISDTPFRPAGSLTALHAKLSKYPEYISSPIHIAVRKREDGPKKDPFKYNVNQTNSFHFFE